MSADERIARVSLTGNLDVYRRDVVATSLPEPGSVDQVIIDCSSAQFVDSSFITQLMRYRRDFIAAGRDPFNIVVIVTPSLRRIFDVTGISRVMTLITAPTIETT